MARIDRLFFFTFGALIFALLLLLAFTRRGEGVTKIVRIGSESPTTNALSELMDRFARTLTERDVVANTELFHAGATVNFYRVMQFLPQPPGGPLVLSLAQWETQLNVQLSTHVADHMTLTNYAVTELSDVTASMSAVGYYTFPVDVAPGVVPFPTKYTTYVASFTVNFLASCVDYDWKLDYAEALPNATVSVLKPFSSGTATSPGPYLSRSLRSLHRLRAPIDNWNTLLGQIDALCVAGQEEVAVAICSTPTYLSLMSVFDPTGVAPENKCNTLQGSVVLNELMVCEGDGAIDASCIGNLTVVAGIQTINMIDPDVDKDYSITGGPSIAVTGGANGLTLAYVGPTSIALAAPAAEFDVSGSPITTGAGTLTFTKRNQAAATVWAGPVSGVDAPPTFRMLEETDLPPISLNGSGVYGVLETELGGTGASQTLAGCRIMTSSCDGAPEAIVEGPLLGPGEFLSGSPPAVTSVVAGAGVTVEVNMDGNVEVSAVASVVTLDPPPSIFEDTSVGGNLSFVIVDQVANTVWAGPTAGADAPAVFRALVADDLPLVDVAHGGTNNAVLSGGAIMVSNAAGDAIVEGSLDGGDGITVVGDGAGNFTVEIGGVCASSTLDSSCLDISGETCTTPIGASCIPSALSLTMLSVSGTTTLGTTTTCAAPIDPGCVDISNESCPGGPLSSNCLPDDVVFNSIIVNDLTVINGTLEVEMGTQEALNVTFLRVDTIVLEESLMCDAGATIDPGCIDISGEVCSSPITQSCLPLDAVFQNVDVTNNLTVNQVSCEGGPLEDACIPQRVHTINGQAVDDFVISEGTGIDIVPYAGGVTISTDISVGLAAPAEFVVSGSPVTEMGTLTLSKAAQAANTVWAGPVGGGPAVPTFRALTLSDYPAVASGDILVGTGSGVAATTIVADPGILVTAGAGSLTIGNAMTVGLALPSAVFTVTTPSVSGAGGTLTAVLDSQLEGSVFAAPLGGDGTPVFRALDADDLPAFANGTILVGTGDGVAEGSIVGGVGIDVTESGGVFTVDNTGVTSVSLALPASLFDVTTPTVTTTGTLTAVLEDQAANTFFAGPAVGADATPTFRTLVLDDLTSLALADDEVLVGVTGGAPVAKTIVGGANVAVMNTASNIIISMTDFNETALGTVMSVDLALPSSVFAVSGGPVMDVGVLTGDFVDQPAALVFAGPVSGVDATPTFRALELSDLPGVSDPNDIYIGGNVSTLTAGPGIDIDNDGMGTTTISSTITQGITSVGLDLPSSVFDVTVTPVTGTGGVLTAVFEDQPEGTFFAAPISGGSGTPAFRAIELCDLPPLDMGQIYIGTSPASDPVVSTLTAGLGITITPGVGTITISGTGGTVTSVGLTAPAEFVVAGSPVTSSGTLAVTKAVQAAHTVWAGPSVAGPAAVPTFRALVSDDIPGLDTSKLVSGVLPVERGGTNSGTALLDDRIMVSSGGSIVEAAALLDGQLLIGSTGSAPVAATLTAGANVEITNAGGSITIASSGSEMNPDSVACHFDDFYTQDRDTNSGLFHTFSAVWDVAANDGVVERDDTGVNTVDRALGVVRMTVEDDSGDYVSLSQGMHSQATDQLLGGYAKLEMSFRVQMQALPTGSNDYRVYLGFHDVPTSGDPDDGVYFTVRRTGAFSSSTAWVFAARRDNSESAVVTTAPIATSGYQVLHVVLNEAGTQAQGFVDGVLVATITTNLPTSAGREFGFGMKMQRVGNGNSDRSMFVDYAKMCSTFSMER